MNRPSTESQQANRLQVIQQLGDALVLERLHRLPVWLIGNLRFGVVHFGFDAVHWDHSPAWEIHSGRALGIRAAHGKLSRQFCRALGP